MATGSQNFVQQIKKGWCPLQKPNPGKTSCEFDKINKNEGDFNSTFEDFAYSLQSSRQTIPIPVPVSQRRTITSFQSNPNNFDFLYNNKDYSKKKFK